MELLPQLIRERQQETLKKLIDTFLAGVNRCVWRRAMAWVGKS
jgi:hypothetical protein